jgi:type VI protein secretion system component Hcp
MTRNQKLGGNSFGRIASGAAILLLMGSAPLVWAPAVLAADAAYIHIPGMDGASKDAAHMSWISASSVVSGDLNGDAAADRDSASPAMSEMTARKENIGSQSSGSGAGKVAMAPRDASSGMASGKRMHKPFVITKEVDKSSPLLTQFCASGKHINEVDIDSAGMHYKLTDVLIASDTKSGGADRPMETISFTYQKIEMK